MNMSMNQLSDDPLSSMGIEVAILVSGVDVVSTLGIKLSELHVETTIDSEADTCEFTVNNLWDLSAGIVNSYSSALVPGSDVEVAIALDRGLPVTVFSGLISHFTIEGRDSEGLVLRVRCTDYSMVLMSGRMMLDSWQDMSYTDVVIQLAGSYGMIPDVDPFTMPVSLGVVVREDPEDNDFQFIQKLAHRIGYQFYVSGRTLYFKKSGGSSFFSSAFSYSYGEDMIDFSMTVDLLSQVSNVMVQGWDHTLGIPRVGLSTPEPSMSSWSGTTLLARAGVVTTHFVAEEVASEEQANNRAKLIYQDHARQFVRGSIKVQGDPTVTTNSQVSLDGVGDPFSGSTFECYRVRHSITAHDGYTTTLILRGTQV